jgi:hypothetical protein
LDAPNLRQSSAALNVEPRISADKPPPAKRRICQTERRHTILLAAILVLTPALGWALTATAQSGAKTQITTPVRVDGECNPSRVEVTVLAAPANGTVTSERKDIVVPAKNAKGEAQKCAGKTVAGVAVFYQSKPGFAGKDSFRNRRFNPNDANDRFNQELSYDVTVK